MLLLLQMDHFCFDLDRLGTRSLFYIGLHVYEDWRGHGRILQGRLVTRNVEVKVGVRLQYGLVDMDLSSASFLCIFFILCAKSHSMLLVILCNRPSSPARCDWSVPRASL